MKSAGLTIWNTRSPRAGAGHGNYRTESLVVLIKVELMEVTTPFAEYVDEGTQFLNFYRGSFLGFERSIPFSL